MKTISAQELNAATRYRKQQGFEAGVVVLFNGEVQGWVNQLRNPESWRPGCIAIDEDGKSWTSALGNHQDGALMWLPNDIV